MSEQQKDGGVTLTSRAVAEWLLDRQENCAAIAARKTGADRDGWLEDEQYFAAAAALIIAEIERLDRAAMCKEG